MPDTGAPWNIPYADPTDLVRDWPDLSEDVADAVALGLTNAGNAGIGSNVVQTVKTDTFSTTSTTFGDVSDLVLSITPSSETSKILLVASVNAAYSDAGDSARNGLLSLFRESTNLAVPDSPGSRNAGMAGVWQFRNDRSLGSQVLTFLDAPNTTSSVTYSVRVRSNSGSGTLFINQARTDTDATSGSRGVSVLTAIEVAG